MYTEWATSARTVHGHRDDIHYTHDPGTDVARLSKDTARPSHSTPVAQGSVPCGIRGGSRYAEAIGWHMLRKVTINAGHGRAQIMECA